jgi:hypothetical protein
MQPTGKPVTKPGVSVAGHTFNPPDPSTTAIVQLASDSPNAGPVLEGTAFGYQQNLPGSTRLDWTQLGPGSLSGIDHVIVISHGVPGKVQYGSPPKYVDGKFVAGLLTDAGYTPKPGSEVFLSACNGGTVCMPNLLDTSLFNFFPNKQTPSVATQMAGKLGTGVIAPVADDPKLANVPQNNRPGNEVSQFSNPAMYPPGSPFTPQQPVHGVIAGGFKTCGASP